jgi:hypothetical protein
VCVINISKIQFRMVQKTLAKLKRLFFSPIYSRLSIMQECLLENTVSGVKSRVLEVMPDNIIQYGFKVYSSCDEDGIIKEIMRRISPKDKVFFEIGCGYGLENNSHYLLLNGWKGTWLDGDVRFIDKIANTLGGKTFDNLLVENVFITKDNILEVFENTYKYHNANEIDFFSLDIDGNDYHILKLMFENGIFPKAVCVEYNGKFPYPVELKVSYKEDFVWQSDDYMGVSLGSWVEIFSKFDYTLICCDVSGNNSFFVRNEYADLFTIYDPAALYQPSRYFLRNQRVGHPASMKFLKNMLQKRKEVEKSNISNLSHQY